MGSMPPGTGLMPDSAAEIAQQVDILRHRTTETGKLLRQMEQEQENFALHYHECTKLKGTQLCFAPKYVGEIIKVSCCVTPKLIPYFMVSSSSSTFAISANKSTKYRIGENCSAAEGYF